MKYEWCRLYNKIIKNQVMRGMPGDWFRAWVFLMVLANQSPERGFICVDDRDGLANLLCVRAEELEPLMVKLEKAGMARWSDDKTIELINFRELQYDYPSNQPEEVAKRKTRAQKNKPSTSRNERRTSKERAQNESGTNENERGTSGERGTEYRVQNSTPLLSPRERMDFDRFWAAYPSRQKQNRKGAEEAWAELIHTPDNDGELPDPENIIAAARHYAQATEDTLPKFIRRAKNFLEKHTWEDYVHGIPDADKPADVIPAGRYIPGVEATRKYLEEQRRQFEGGAANG